MVHFPDCGELLSFKKSGRSRGLNLLFKFLMQSLNCKNTVLCHSVVTFKAVLGASQK